MTIDQSLDTVDMMLNMGPQHPSTHGVFRMVLTVDGENIVDVQRPRLRLPRAGVEHEELAQVGEDTELEVGKPGLGMGGIEELFHASHFTPMSGNNPAVSL